MRVLLVIILAFISVVVYAQPVPPGPPPPNPVPITGIEILIGAGALLGVRRLQHLKKTNS